MKVTVIKANEISDELRKIWYDIQRESDELSSPYFSHQFTSAVASVYPDSYVGVIEDENRITGFFPFHKDHHGNGGPIGRDMSDYQGVIIKKNYSWSVEELIRKCNLRTWSFDHLLISQEQFEPYHSARTESPILDLSRGFEVYKQERNDAGTQQIRQIHRRIRQLEHEIGVIQFNAHIDDISVFKQMVSWKIAQYKQTNSHNDFDDPRIGKLLERIFYIQNHDFSGLLSVLFVEDAPAAIHMGMRSDQVWHWWYPSYSVNYKKYSPGLILLLKMAEYSEPLGINMIDLGKGAFHYKKRLMNSSIPIAEGRVII